MYHCTVLKCAEQLKSKEYEFKRLRGSRRVYQVNNETPLSTEQAQKIVDILVESVFKQNFSN